MPRQAEAQLKQKVLGGVIYVRFYDPRPTKKTQVFASCKTVEIKIAERIRDEITRLIRCPAEWNTLPKGLHPRTVAIWQPVSDQVRQAIQAVPLLTEAFTKNLPEHPKDFENSPEARQLEKLLEAQEQIKAMLEQVAILTSERDGYREENIILRDQLRRMGARAVKAATAKTISACVKDYLAHGIATQGRWRAVVKSMLDRFANHLGNTVNVLDVEPKQVIAYLNGLTVSESGKLQHRKTICSFLNHATNGHFDRVAVNKAVILKPALEEWYWLTKEQTTGLIENLKTQSGQYWADAATLQYGCGFRPEELAILQMGKVELVGGVYQIHVCPIMQKGSIVRRLKTTASNDVVIVPSFAVEALKRRMAEKAFLLFPSKDEWLPKKHLATRSKFEASNNLWANPDTSTFSTQYLQRLKRAANGLAGVDLGKIDSRLLRRTCARELVLKYGIDRAASVLRDDVETIRKHYANLVASDTSTER